MNAPRSLFGLWREFLTSTAHSLPLPSARALARANTQLQQEIEIRHAAEENLRAAQMELEARVAVRTAELVAANERLEREIRERRHAQDHLHQAVIDRENLLREVHHRVKNNLQMMTSLLNLQIRSEPSEALRQKLHETQNRINALSVVHKKLYSGEDMTTIDLPGMLAELCKQLGSTYRVAQNGIGIDVQADMLYADMDRAIPLALLTTEAVTNSLKFAFPDGAAGTVRVCLSDTGVAVILRITDDGIGFTPPPDGPGQTPVSLGTTLMRGLARQLDGTLEMRGEKGAEVLVTMKRGHFVTGPGLRKIA